MEERTNQGDGSRIPKEFKPGWWADKLIGKDYVVIIPDTEFPNEVPGMEIDFGGANGNKGVDYNTGVIVKAGPAIASDAVGKWCFYAPAGTQKIHPFRKRFDHGRDNPLAEVPVLVCHRDRVILITNICIF